MEVQARWALVSSGSHHGRRHIADRLQGWATICPAEVRVPRTVDGGLDGNRVFRTSDFIGDLATDRRLCGHCETKALSFIGPR